MKQSSLINLLFPTLVVILISGCQSTGHPVVYLMPAPIAITEGVVDPAVVKKTLSGNNEVSVFYATNRKPSGPDDNGHYITDFDQSLRLGVAKIRIGEMEQSAEEVFNQAITADRKKKIPLLLEQVTQQAVIADSQNLDDLTNETRAYLDSINAALANSDDKDITIYVHGANNTFTRSSSQAAQFRYFTGRQSVVLMFSWPSAGSLIHYGVDVKNSAQSYKVFARLIDLLSRYTDARYINILSYSAGARVASPGLNHLSTSLDIKEPESLRKRLRLGIVYYAEPDEYQADFFHHLASYLHLTQSATVTVNFHDSVLAYAETYSGKAEAGMPDASQFSDTDKKELLTKLNKQNFHVIDIDGSVIPGLARGEHGAWYNHPWINTDVIIQFLHHAGPAERGLVIKEIDLPWSQYWIYPVDYPDRIRKILPALKERNSLM